MDTSSATIADAQREMRIAYFGGAPGMFTSAVVWLTAGIACLRTSAQQAVWALFVGGMLIHPVASLLNRALGRRAKHTPGNPFGALALASTFWLVLSLPLAYCVSLLRIEWFFPAMLFVIGGRYLTFSTIFGARIYWLCGGALVVAGYLLGRAQAAPAIAAFTGSAIEAGFAIAIFVIARREIAAEKSIPVRSHAHS
jgi:hypothetical protein